MAGNSGFSGIYPGFIFLPSDQVLLSFYLRRKIDGQAADDQVFGSIPMADLFGRDAPAPWLLHPAASKNSSSCNVPSGIVTSKVTDWFYCFARTSRRGSGSCRTTNCGTWLTSGGDKRVMGSAGGEESVTLGYKNTLAFKIPTGVGGSKWVPTCWVMHKFKLHRGHPDVRRKAATAATTKKNTDHNRHLSEEEEAAELVLCRIRCTKPTKPSEMSSGLGFGALQPADEELGRPQKRQRTGCSSDESGSHPDLEPTVRSEGEGGQASLVGSSPSSSSSSMQYGFGSTYQLEQQQVVAPTTPAAPDVEFLRTGKEVSLQNPSVVTAAGVSSAAPFPDQLDGVND